MRTSKTGRVRKSLRLFGLSKTLGRERGFTLAELMIVIIIIGLMLTIVTLAYMSGTRKSEVVAATEQVKQALRLVYSLADSGALATTADPNTPKKWYRITFHNPSEDPPNACRVEVSSASGAAGSWSEVAPDSHGGSYKVVTRSGEQWAQLGTADILMTYSAQTITYMPKGSILTTSPSGDKTITVGSSSDSSAQTITVNDWGTLTE